MKKISEVKWELEKEGKMRVPARIFASEPLIQMMKRDRSFGQLKNVAQLPGIVNAALCMPDGHEGYGFPIGGVAAFGMEDGIISPGGVGYTKQILNLFGAETLTAGFGCLQLH